VTQLRVVVVGAGGAAQVVHLPILKRLPELEVVALVDDQEHKARTIADRFGVPEVFADLAGVKDLGDADAALICTPTDTHEELVLACLSAGLHVLCERPMATTAESVERMVEAARLADRQLMVAMNLRYRFDVRAIRQFIVSGELGDVFFVRSVSMNPRYRRPRRGWRRDAMQAGGGVLMDLGAQAIDAALWLLDSPNVERVSARFHGSGEVEDTAVVLLDLEGGASVAVETTWELMDSGHDHSLSVLGTRGSASTAPFRLVAELETGLTDVTPPQDSSPGSMYTASYRQEWAEFLRFVRGQKTPEPPTDQVALHRVIEACYASAEQGRDVELGKTGSRG